MPADESAPSAVREAPRELLALVCAMRSDWTTEETWSAILACKTASFEWHRITRGLVDLALRDEPVPTRPKDLWAAIRGLRSLPGTGSGPDPTGEGGADYLAAKAAMAARATGPQARLTATGELEFLREGPDP
jgi:hypothetical protein